MEENRISISKKGIYYPAAGLISILTSYVIGNSSSGLNVHSGEIFLWLLIVLAFGVIIPVILFVKSLAVIRQAPQREESKIKTYSTVLTYSLGAVLLGLLLFLLWTTLK